MDIKTFEDDDARNMSNKDHKELQMYGIATLMEFRVQLRWLLGLSLFVVLANVFQTILLLTMLAQLVSS